MNNLNLPDYKDQSPDVQERFSEIYKRPVILNIHNLTSTFNSNKGTITALKNVNFLAHRREFICVIGASGCGKSTLIRILAGLVEPSEGSALLDGSPISGPGPDRGMVFQEYTLFPWLTVKRNVMFGLQMAGHTFHHAEQEALQAKLCTSQIATPMEQPFTRLHKMPSTTPNCQRSSLGLE